MWYVSTFPMLPERNTNINVQILLIRRNINVEDKSAVWILEVFELRSHWNNRNILTNRLTMSPYCLHENHNTTLLEKPMELLTFVVSRYLKKQHFIIYNTGPILLHAKIQFYLFFYLEVPCSRLSLCPVPYFGGFYLPKCRYCSFCRWTSLL